MSDTPEIRSTVERYFAAMRRGAEAEEEMMALFSDDATYIEPFGGQLRTSIGKDAIRTALRSGWEFPLPDLKLVVHRIDVGRGTATSWWTCESPGLPAPVRGRDHYQIADGLITHLTVEFDE
jgi:hypothetical protein